MKRKLLLIFSLLLLISFITACSGDKPAQKNEQAVKTIKLDHNWGPDHPHHIAFNEIFKSKVEDESDGTLKVEIYGNNQLGGEREIFDGVNNGTIEMIIAGTVMSNDIEKWAVAGDWPFLIEDFEHAKRVFTGEVGREIADDIEAKANVNVLGWGASGFRMFSSKNKISSFEDFSGMRIRMPNIPTYTRMGELLGINVTSLDFTEVFTALEQGVAEGQENPISILKSNGWYEVQDYVLESRHIFFANAVLINRTFWEELSSEQQQIIEKAMEETLEKEWDLISKSEEEDKKFLEEQGMVFTTPDNEFMNKIKNAMEPLYDELYQDFSWAKDMVEKIKDEAN